MNASSNPRAATTGGMLARLGFVEPDRAEQLLASPTLADCVSSEVLEAIADVAEPDLALLSLSRVLDAADDQVAAKLRAALATDPGTRDRLLSVLGVSEAVGDHLVRHPSDWEVLSAPAKRVGAGRVRSELLTAVGADPERAVPVAAGHGSEQLDALRREYHRQLIRIVCADVAEGLPFDSVAEDLSDVADAALETALAIAQSEAGSPPCRFAVIALGKCGGRELNYASDVDVVFVVASTSGDDDGAVRDGTRLATALMRACSATTREGSLWEVDAALRPEGKSGALVRTLDSHVGYYERWAQTWEFQALLKARPAAGDMELGRRYADAVSQFVWSAAGRPNFVDDVQAMRRRVEHSVVGAAAARQLKLGPGGLRDVEFSVQLLQLVHGRSDVMLRSPNTMRALEALSIHGYVGLKDAAQMAAAYRFLRTMEHRIQMYRLKRTHLVPESERDLRRIARSMGMRAHPQAQLESAWGSSALDARRLHEKLFYRPLLQAVARLDSGEARLTPDAARQRLAALGFADPASALRHIEALTSGITRRSAIQRTLLPVMLSWFADGPDPDAALLGFRQVSEALGGSPWFLGMLRDESVTAQRLAKVLGSSRYASELLQRAPEGVRILGSDDELVPFGREQMEVEALGAASRHDEPEAAIQAIRGIRRRELFRLSVGDVLRLTDVEQVGRGLSDVTMASLAGALSIAGKGRKPAVRFLVVAMGRMSAGEASYSSDADVMFVYEAVSGVQDEEAGQIALGLANEMARLLTLPSADPALVMDADLRPEGRNGPVVRSLDSYRAYYSRWSSTWEAQALLRAGRACGDGGLWKRFVQVINPLRYPDGGLASEQRREIRKLKARVEAERLPRGADPTLHTKLGRGGLSDVEWTVQLLQMDHAYAVEGLRTTSTLEALACAKDNDLIAEQDAEQLASAWTLAARVRNAIMLATGRPGDVVPGDARSLARTAHVMGYGPGESQELVEDYRRTARRARRVVERIFYGE
ncbi:MAG: bifunctional [glutamine synthetase] adenylyltransferase/[glutamine synthetase]-adenylyl-L-tyrosine phosphorylase [Candidatus Nanopelagicales bacterium]|nr:bifunctional [glutamine synthetase] adenylyltransferase/[glutamine synthetase]-adenylyl-L-tyrosine phosphorylase [Candidatus Nanopelagicales bacterium]MDZ4250848.1 bifunctional [glutamine synthetase] adenylyltransferase/[glutamine synthetase]-adenylyl-L-tyrosine phosphorylase [Candidatus Nanopelagicales bacterium]